MIIDSHCHLDYEPMFSNLDNVIKRADQSNVKIMLTISVADKKYNNIIEILDKSLVIIIFVSTIIGFISYVIKEKREHKRFSWYKFFIGVDHCKNI